MIEASAQGLSLPEEKIAGVELIISQSQPGKLAYELKNNSGQDIGLGMMSCSTFDQFLIQGKVVLSWGNISCFINMCTKTEISSGSSLKGIVPIRRTTNDSDITTKLGFSSCDVWDKRRKPGLKYLDRSVYWSNELSIPSTNIPALTKKERKGLIVNDKPLSTKGGVLDVQIK